MKKVFVMFLFMFGSAAYVSAQMSQDDVALVQSMYGMNKRDLVKKYMALTPKQDSLFWPIYDAYEKERKAIGEQRLRGIEDYAKNYATLTDEKADELVKKSFELETSMTKLQQKYYSKLKKPLTPLKAAQFIQLENFLNNVVRAEIQSEIPFIGEIERK
jgi:Spy/CpxP family protein refolding chaperone